MIKIHVYYRPTGEHVHCRVFVGRQDQQLALAGQLVLRVEEFLALARGQFQTNFFEEEGNG